jgi:hypothetical protein
MSHIDSDISGDPDDASFEEDPDESKTDKSFIVLAVLHFLFCVEQFFTSCCSVMYQMFSLFLMDDYEHL